MASKQVTDHQKSADFVGSSLTTYEQRIVDAFCDQFAPPRDRAEVARAVRLVIGVVGGKLKGDVDATVSADDAYAREAGDDVALLEQRDAQFAAVREQVVSVRASLNALVGARALASTGVGGETPESPVEFHRWATTFVESLETVKLPASRIAGVSFDAKRVAAELKPSMKALGATLEAVTRDERENQAAMVDRDRKWATSRTTFSHAANFASALLGVAGEAELARRVRPAGRKPGTVAEPDDVDVPQPAPAATGTDPVQG